MFVSQLVQHPTCSVQLSQKFSQYYAGSRNVPILSKASAPGLVLGTGSIGDTLGASDSQGVFRSSTAGASWRKVRRNPDLLTSPDPLDFDLMTS